jgi:ComF family protein
MLGAMIGSLRTGLPPGDVLNSTLRRIGAGLRRLAAPHCAVCRVELGDPICPGCLRDYFDACSARCRICAGRLPGAQSGLPCGRCLSAPPGFDRTIALGDYAPPLDGMVMALKSGGRLDLARVFGQLLASRIEHGSRIDCLVAVPLAAQRQRERGFNQSLEIARAVARRLSVPLRGAAVVRVRSGPPQQSLPFQARRRNVRGAFATGVSLPARCAGVVDDVMTTGATLDEMARVLKRAGVVQVVNLVVARTEEIR